MKTTIKADMKRGKYRRPHFDVLNDVAEILNNFIINNKLEKKRIKYKGLRIKNENSVIVVKYEFVDEFNNVFKRKNVRSLKEEREADNGNKKTRKRNPAT
jgi:hypothetical protein